MKAPVRQGKHLEAVQLLQTADHVALQEQDNKVATGLAQELYVSDTLLVQVQLAQGRHHAFIMLCSLHSSAS